ncbi:MAG: hypothetical protein U0599_11190 [Vicinamibacteria bacterium]
MRTWWDEAEAFHLRCGAAACDGGLWNAVARAVATAGLLDLGIDQTTAVSRHRVGRPGGSRAFGLNVIREGDSDWHVLVSPAFDSQTDEQEADLVSDLAYSLGVATDAIGGRSFSYVDGNGFLTADEVDGPLRWVDWLQYFSSAVADRVGRDRLTRMPAFERRDGQNGGVFVRTTRLPYAAYSRRELAGYLGITLRTMRDWNPETRTWSEREWPT